MNRASKEAARKASLVDCDWCGGEFTQGAIGNHQRLYCKSRPQQTNLESMSNRGEMVEPVHYRLVLGQKERPQNSRATRLAMYVAIGDDGRESVGTFLHDAIGKNRRERAKIELSIAQGKRRHGELMLDYHDYDVVQQTQHDFEVEQENDPERKKTPRGSLIEHSSTPKRVRMQEDNEVVEPSAPLSSPSATGFMSFFSSSSSSSSNN
jgi:hypothetical protein